MTILNHSLHTFSTRRESLITSGEELRRFLEDAGMQERGREVSGHLLRLELDSVKIAVIGEFKAGKWRTGQMMGGHKNPSLSFKSINVKVRQGVWVHHFHSALFA